MTGFVAYWVYQEPVFFLHPTTGKVTSGIIEEWREAKPGRGQESQLEGGISRQVLKRYGSEFQVLIRETGTKEEPVLLFANELYEFREDAEHAAVCAYVRKHRKRVVRKQMAVGTLGETVIDDFLPSPERSTQESALPVYDRRNGLIIPQPEQVADFFQRMDHLCRRYGYSLAFDDGIVLEPYSQENMDAIRRAELSLDDNLPGRGKTS